MISRIDGLIPQAGFYSSNSRNLLFYLLLIVGIVDDPYRKCGIRSAAKRVIFVSCSFSTLKALHWKNIDCNSRTNRARRPTSLELGTSSSAQLNRDRSDEAALSVTSMTRLLMLIYWSVIAV